MSQPRKMSSETAELFYQDHPISTTCHLASLALDSKSATLVTLEEPHVCAALLEASSSLHTLLPYAVLPKPPMDNVHCESWVTFRNSSCKRV